MKTKLIPLLFCLFASFALKAEVVESESFKYYSVAPKNGQSLLVAMKESSAIVKDGVVRFGQTTWSITPQYNVRRFTGSCYVSKISVQLDIVFTLPQLSPHAKVSENTRKKFDFFYDALYQHELGHKRLGIEAARKIQEALAQRTIYQSCQELHDTTRQQINAVINEYMALNHDYDLRTQYGRTQGAVMSDVIMVE